MLNFQKRLLRGGKKLFFLVIQYLVTFTPSFFLRSVIYRLIGISVGRMVSIHSMVYVYDFGRLSIGDSTTINHACLLDNRGGLSIGSRVNISMGTSIFTAGHDTDIDGSPITYGKVNIEDDVWIYPNVMIMPGVTLGEGAVVYPGSIVSKSFPPRVIIAGVPAKVIGTRSENVRNGLDNRVLFAK